MRLVPVIAFAALAAGVALGARQGAVQTATQEPSFRAGTHAVSVYVTVVDSAGRLVPDLTKDDFEVYDDGKKQDLTLFTNDIQPITIVIMLDRSGSMVKNFDLERDAAEQFVINLLKADKARLGSFSNRIEIDPVTFTSDQSELIRILHENLLDAGVTPLWGATSAAMSALEHQEGRRVVLVFTDGYDNPEVVGRSVSFEDVRRRALDEEVMVYAIGLADACAPSPAALERPGVTPLSAGSPASQTRYQRGMPPPRTPPMPGVGRGPDNGGAPMPPNRGMPLPGAGTPLGPGISIPLDKLLGRGHTDTGCSTEKPDPSLRDLAAEGGGAYFELHGTDALGPTFARVADELHHQYLLAFKPEKLDSRVHNLEVRVNRPNLVIRARRSYIASADR